MSNIIKIEAFDACLVPPAPLTRVTTHTNVHIEDSGKSCLLERDLVGFDPSEAHENTVDLSYDSEEYLSRAATTIQKNWRGFTQRKAAKMKALDKLLKSRFQSAAVKLQKQFRGMILCSAAMNGWK